MSDRSLHLVAIDAPTRLHVVTAGPPATVPCEGGYLCPCEKCRGTIATITPKGAGAAAFKVRRVRKAA